MSNPYDQPHPSTSGNVEFRCSQCQQMLKISDSLIGRQVRCPQCSAVQTVPPAAMANSPVANPMPPLASAPVPAGYDSQNPSSPMQQNQNASYPANPAPSQMPTAPTFSQSPTTPQQPVTNPLGATLDPGRVTNNPNLSGTDTPTRQLYQKITAEIAKIFVGQDELVMGTLVALFSNGHVLIESVPGLGKTLFVRTLGNVLGCDFGRIQFTADLMPSDITGAPIYNMKTQEFDFRPGPVFTQLLLADEINRSPAKTHAALLEIMQERTVTIDGKTHVLKEPFLVMATQNPIESEGTYNLPEAQLDRFMFKLIADYPSAEDEARILTMHGGQEKLNDRLEKEIQQITTEEQIVETIRNNASVRVDPSLLDYINKIVRLTREWQQFHIGASPRAGISLIQGARTLAAFYGRDYAVPDDVVQIALPTLRHRVTLTAEAEVEGQNVDQLLAELIRTVEVPRLQ